MKKKLLIKKILLFIVLPIITSTIGSIIYSKIKNINFIDAFIQLLLIIFNFIISFFTMMIPLWLIIVVITIYFIIKKVRIKIKQNIKLDLPDWLNYREDQFKEWIWRWDWIQNNYGKFVITNLSPYCEKCKCELTDISRISKVLYKCPNCNTVYGRTTDYKKVEFRSDIEKLILHSIQEKKYKDKIND